MGAPYRMIVSGYTQGAHRELPSGIGVFQVDEGGMLSKQFVCSSGGATPRHFALSPDGALLAVANQTSDAVTVFTRDVTTGKLTSMTQFGFTAPSCIIWE